MTQSLTARAPAKLIISGEHSVLYGQPALAMAVNCYTSTTTSWRNDKFINFKLNDLNYNKQQSCSALKDLADSLYKNYRDYLNGHLGIREVFNQPFYLLQYSVSSLIDKLKLPVPRGFDFSVESTIPMGCGMGSSASTIISALYALANLFNLNWQAEDYLQFGREIENLQHGRSSGLDLHLVTHGGCVLFRDGKAEARKPPAMQLFIVNTGKPESTTGECVTSVAKAFAASNNLASDFGAVTAEIDLALAENRFADFKTAIQENHRLLNNLAVVPSRVAAFISEIEQHGGAAKICGSGAITGDNAGIVLLVSEQNLEDIVSKYGYQIQAIQMDHHGTKII